jgi:phosphotransferase family enzyme
MNSNSIVWALNTLQRVGYTIQNPTPEIILQTPWSRVYRLDTDQGHCYLKQVPAGLFLEPQVIYLLRENCGASVPMLIADNLQEHCFLMQDAGISLREFLKQGFNAELLTTAIYDYIAVQHKSIPHLNRLLDLGVSDWRLEKIPACYVTLLQQESLLIADGLKKVELKQLSQLIPKLTELCEQLSQYSLPNTFSHNDFHDNNLLIDLKTQKITMVDLGEVAITHPFFSLLNMLHQIKKNDVLPEDIYQHLEQQTLQSWSDYASQDELLAAMSLIKQCWSIHRALTVYRVLTSIDTSAVQQLLGQGRLAKNLRIWLAQSM